VVDDLHKAQWRHVSGVQWGSPIDDQRDRCKVLAKGELVVAQAGAGRLNYTGIHDDSGASRDIAAGFVPAAQTRGPDMGQVLGRVIPDLSTFPLYERVAVEQVHSLANTFTVPSREAAKSVDPDDVRPGGCCSRANYTSAHGATTGGRLSLHRVASRGEGLEGRRE